MAPSRQQNLKLRPHEDMIRRRKGPAPLKMTARSSNNLMKFDEIDVDIVAKPRVLNDDEQQGIDGEDDGVEDKEKDSSSAQE